MFVQSLNHVVGGPLHEPYEQPNSPMISEKSSTIKQPYARSAPSSPPPLLPQPKPWRRRGAKRFLGGSISANISVHQRSCLHARRPYKRSPPAPSPPAKARGRRGDKRFWVVLYQRIFGFISGPVFMHVDSGQELSQFFGLVGWLVASLRGGWIAIASC